MLEKALNWGINEEQKEGNARTIPNLGGPKFETTIVCIMLVTQK
jgi:hypothetical protein